MFYTNLKYYRKKGKITQKKLSVKSNISQSYISELEKETKSPKNPSLEVIEDLAISLNCCPRLLIMFDCNSCKIRENKKCSIEECKRKAILDFLEHI